MQKFRNGELGSAGKALIFEPCTYHYTLVPCYIYYLQELNYEVELLMHDSFNEKAELGFWKQSDVLIHRFCDPELTDVLSVVDFSSYDLIWIATLNYTTGENIWTNPFDRIGCCPQPRDGLYGIIHSVASVSSLNLRQYRFARVFSLVDARDAEPKVTTITLLYDGKLRFEHPVSSQPCFTLTGVSNTLSGITKAFTLLEDSNQVSANYISSNAIRKFWFLALAKRMLGNKLPERGIKWKGVFPNSFKGFLKARKRLHLLGRLPSDQMYRIVRDSDYLVAHFEGEQLRKFTEDRISGQALLSLGFEVPLVIDARVARAWHFDSNECITYQNGNLVEGLRAAVAMNDREYQEMRHALQRKKTREMQRTLSILREAIEESRTRFDEG